MEIKEILELLSSGIDPTTGELFDLSIFGKKDTYEAFKALKEVAVSEHKKASQKGRYARLCLEYPDRIVIVKTGYFYSAYNECAEILGQVMGYKVAYLSGRTPTTGGPDLGIIADRLQSKDLSYIVFNGDEIEEKYDGKNPFV